MTTVIYARVSTQHQDYARQLSDLRAFADRTGLQILKVFEEKISGAKKREDRPQLKAMLQYIAENNVQKVLCWELSRLGRNTIDTLQIIEQLTKDKICLQIYNLSLETLSPSKEPNTIARFMLTIMAELASMERLQLQQRLRSGYIHYRSTGGSVGRSKGYKKSPQALRTDHNDIIRLLHQNYSARNIASITEKSINTVRKIKALFYTNLDTKQHQAD